MKNLTLSLLLLLLLPGCITIVKWKYGITTPREQSPASVLRFAEKRKYPKAGQFIFCDSAAYCAALRDSLFKKNLFGAMIFDREGRLLHRDTTRCQWSGYSRIAALSPDTIYPVAPKPYLPALLSHLCGIGTDQGADTSARADDFTVVVTWAMFIGNLNDRLFDLDGAALENRRARVRMIWLNTDMQAAWKLKGPQRMSID